MADEDPRADATDDNTPQADDEDVVRGDRFSGGPARGFLSSMIDDERIFAADLAVDRAHVVMLCEQGIVSETVAGDILTALSAIEEAGFDRLPNAEDVHAAIETAVIDRLGAEGGRMHTARSRNDEVAACIRYRLREDVLDLIEATVALRDVLVTRAGDHTGTVMPGYTHLQPAQPTTVGHWLASYDGALARDTERLFDVYDRVNRSPLGAAAFAGTAFPIDRDRVADLLGFDGVIENATDAVSTRDFLVETAGAIAALSATLSGLAEDVIVFSNRGFITLDDDYASTSSIMPQKKNPDTMELVRATAGDATGGLTALLTTVKGLPRAYNRDLQAATPHVWSAVDAVVEATTIAAGALDTAVWDERACLEAAGEGFATATGVADLLAREGVPFRQAHEVVARAARNGGDVAAIDAAARTVLGDPLEELVDPAAVEAALDPRENVAMRDSAGGPAPDTVTDALDRARGDVDADADAVTAERERLEQARSRLRTAVDAYA